MPTISEFVAKVKALTIEAGMSEGSVPVTDITKLVNEFVKSIKAELKKKEKKSDTDKKPLNGYMLFCIAKRQSVVDAPENADKPNKEITSIIAQKWRDEKEKNTKEYQTFQQASAVASQKYKEKKESEPIEKVKKSGKGKKNEASDSSESKKKREPSAYNVFFSQKTAQLKEEDVASSDIPKIISTMWKALSVKEKDAFKGQALTPKKKKEEVAVGAPIKKKAEKKIDDGDEKHETARTLDFSEADEKKAKNVKNVKKVSGK